jgi:hypothetical protein
MSTWIKFKKGGIEAHIVDVCVQGDTVHKFLENGKVYESEHVAVKRAIIYYRKRLRAQINLKRRRNQPVKRKRKACAFDITAPIVIPRILTYFERGETYHLVIETGKKFKRYPMALRNALRYARENK